MFPNTALFTACKDFILSIEPIVLFLDISFISDLLYYINKLFEKPSEKNNLETPKPDSGLSIISTDPLSAESFIIEQFVAKLYIRTKTTRPQFYHYLPRYLSLIPEISDAEIKLPSFKFKDCIMNQSYIRQQIIEKIKNYLLSQFQSLLFNTDILSNFTDVIPSNFIKSNESIMKIGSDFVFGSGENTLKIASKFLHLISLDDSISINNVNVTHKETFQNGLNSLKDGIIDGFKGIYEAPIEMAQKHGFFGAFAGLSKGLFGAITKPVAGVVDAGLGSLSSLKMMISKEDKDIIPPIRIPRALPAHKEIPFYVFNPTQYHEVLDGAQYLFQHYNREFFNETIEYFVFDYTTQTWFAITQRYMFNVNLKPEIIDLWPISDITKIEYRNNQICISFKKSFSSTKTVTITVPNNDVVMDVRGLLQSKCFILKD